MSDYVHVMRLCKVAVKSRGTIGAKHLFLFVFMSCGWITGSMKRRLNLHESLNCRVVFAGSISMRSTLFVHTYLPFTRPAGRVPTALALSNVSF